MKKLRPGHFSSLTKTTNPASDWKLSEAKVHVFAAWVSLWQLFSLKLIYPLSGLPPHILSSGQTLLNVTPEALCHIQTPIHPSFLDFHSYFQLKTASCLIVHISPFLHAKHRTKALS